MTARTLSHETVAQTVKVAADELRRVAGPIFSALERSGLPMVATNPRLHDNPIVFVNDAFCRTTGYASEEVVGRNCRFLQAPEASEDALLQIREAIGNGRAISIEILNQRKDGVRFWNHLFITPVNDENGKPLFFLSTQVDVTQAHQAEEMQATLRASQKELDQTNERLRLTLTVAGTGGSWDWDIPNRRFTADARFAALHGLDPVAAARGLPAQDFFAAIHPEDRLRIRLAVAGILNGAEIFSKEYRLLTPDGSVRWVHARGRCLFGNDDQPLKFTGVLIDITDQKHVEERLRVAQSAGGVGTFEYVEGFATVSVSDEFCRLLGLHPTNTLPIRTINARVVPGDPAIVAQAPGSEGATYVECRIQRADNKETRWLARRGEYVRDTETAGLRFIGVIYDITAAKQSEERLRELNERLESRVEERTRERDRLWSLSSDLFSVCDAHGYLKAVNPAWTDLLGYREDEVVGTRFVTWIHPEDQVLSDHLLTAFQRGQPLKDFDVRIRTKDGADHWISWTFAPAGDVFYSVGRDVTQRKHLEAQLRQSQKMEAIGQLTGGIAHDFNNLLTGIVGSLDLLQTRMAQGRMENLDRYTKAATASANRAAALTHRLLAFARRQPLDPKPVDVNRLVMSMEELLRRTSSEAIELRIVTSEDLPLTLCDPNQLESAILNLAINARDAMPEGGKLVIETAMSGPDGANEADRQEIASGRYVTISVTDTGTGMPPDVMAQAFDPFFTTKPMGEGTGLGLSMVYGFAKQSEGHVRIHSAVGRGTTVKIYLPSYEGEITEAVAAPGLSAAHRAEAGEAVLVVEDEPIVRSLILEVLADLGYQALEAVDGPSGLKMLESKQRVDLLVTDVGLPGLNGRQLADHARLTRPGLKVLFITGYAEQAAMASGFLEPGMEMITKPFAVDELAARIRDIIERGWQGSSR
ncbi:hybrid sensor histidine kinase/response regulator [Microvirga lenta]|uniref:hybrid sensor histidine kinase/response regulator n=1 Tax=Microvirga lenta TaxID=2881337 RepID=UPI001CFFDAAB|nr:PAS domain-containing sensor histidine kinase [Microvirga lenta]MCB5177211.1 PAS domain S-box protein [Microvirga lenta]